MDYVQPFQRSWEDIEEDEHGRLRTSRHEVQRAYLSERKSVAVQDRLVEKGIIRFLFLVVDGSRAIEVNDFRPSRKVVMMRVLSDFIRAFFDQNPISQLGIIISQDKRAKVLTDLSGVFASVAS